MNKLFTHLILMLLFVSVLSCETTIENEVTENKKVELYTTVSAEGVCEITVPKYFIEMDDIHNEALIEYGFMAEDDSIDDTLEDEIYVIVLANYKNELQEVFGDSLEITINDFNMMCQENLSNALTDFSAVFEDPAVNIDNGVKTMHNEFFGRLGEYLVYYQIGIYETKAGYYQVLTWCMQADMQKHKDEMIKITSSFKEL